MKWFCRIVFGIGVLIAMSASLIAQTHFVATIDGDQQVPPVVTSAAGSAEMVLDVNALSLTYSIQLVGLDLDGNQTPGDADDDVVAMHFHRNVPGMNGPVVFGLIAPGHDGDDLVIDPVAGTLTGIWEETDAGASSPLSAELDNLLSGGLYLNVHTTGVGSGEIRGQVVQRSLADGLLLHIEFENNVLDSSPNGFDGQPSGGLQFASGVVGQAADFDGIDDLVLFPTFPDDLITDGDFSISYWFDVPVDLFQSVVGKRQSCNNHRFFEIRTNTSGGMGLEINGGLGSNFVSTASSTGGWHHATLTRSGNVLLSYLNGEMIDQVANPSVFDVSNTATLAMSDSPCIECDGTRMLQGLVDDLRIYNRVLTPAEIGSLGGIFADGFESGDVSAWSGSSP